MRRGHVISDHGGIEGHCSKRRRAFTSRRCYYRNSIVIWQSVVMSRANVFARRNHHAAIRGNRAGGGGGAGGVHRRVRPYTIRRRV